METEVKSKNYIELEQQRDASAVLLLSEMYQTDDLYRRQELFNQSADQEASLMAEVLEGSVKTDFSFETRDGRLYLLQPSGVTDWQEMHKQGLERAKARAAADKKLAPYVKIAEAELAEAADQEAMIKSGKSMAMFKLSLCGDDVMPDAQLRKIGRDPDQQRAYVRVTVFDGSALHVHSRSIDGVNLGDGRRGISGGWGTWSPQARLDKDASSIDILNHAAEFDEQQMSVEEMHSLADRVVTAFDNVRYQRTGKIYKAGRCPEGIDTYKFVLDNNDLFNAHMESMCSLAQRELGVEIFAEHANELRYDIMASYKQRAEGTWIEHVSLADSVAYAGLLERQAGTSFAGCDTVFSGNKAKAAGYVNAESDEQSLLKLEGQAIRCINKSCRKMVVVPSKDLAQGILSCNRCGLVYDVCNKQSSFDPSKVNRTKEQASPGLFEQLSATLARYETERKHKEAVKKLKAESDLAQAA